MHGTELPFPFDRHWRLADAVSLGCLLEASAPKLGNVHPGRAFEDTQYSHFLASACVIRPVFDCEPLPSMGELVLQAASATRERVGCNTNLGTLLLLAPLAHAHSRQPVSADPASRERRSLADLSNGLTESLSSLTRTDSQLVYTSIRLAQPGGLNEQSQHDVAGDAPEDLRSAMRQVADNDAVARQYVNGYRDVVELLVPCLQALLERGASLNDAICETHLRWLAHEPDGLIVRKNGLDVGTEVQQRAHQVLQSGFPQNASWSTALADPQSPLACFDEYLRGEGNRRNPGTSADLIATSLVCLLLGYRRTWSDATDADKAASLDAAAW